MMEPRLSSDDVRIWDAWRRTAAAHAGTRAFGRRVDAARSVVLRAMAVNPSPCLSWSGGKDSTVMVHLVRSEMGIDIPAASEKDDLDYPGEREYVEELAAAWGLRLTILTPPISPAEWFAEHAGQLAADEDVHARTAALSKVAFYDVVEAHGAAHGLIFLGLRAGESYGRRMNRASRGTLYRKRPDRWHPVEGQWVATPLADWDGLDVLAYAESRDIELLPVYRCVALMHRHEPWHLRKSWWLPGANARWGGVVWLRHYWPSLYGRLCRLLPGASLLA